MNIMRNEVGAKMTNDELKKKIVETISNVWAEPVPCTAERKFEHAADALIAAGIGDTRVAERALRRSISFLTCRACQAFFYGPCDTDACGDERCINNFLKQAEKELAEEGKDG